MFYNESEIVNEIITPTIRLRLLTNSIIHYSFLPDVVIDIEAHKINHNSIIKIATLKQHPLLIDGNEYMDITLDAKKFIRSLETYVPILARAFVITSLSNRLLLLSYTKINNSIYPLKTFTKHDEAKNWLLTLIKK